MNMHSKKFQPSSVTKCVGALELNSTLERKSSKFDNSTKFKVKLDLAEVL